MSPSSTMVKRADETENPDSEPATGTDLELPGVKSLVTVIENVRDADWFPAGIVIVNRAGLNPV